MLDLPVDADGVVGVVLALDELFDAHLGHMAKCGKNSFELLDGSHAIGVRRARTRDGLHHDGNRRKPDARRGLAAAGDRGDAGVAGVRMPARSSTCFMISLSRKGTVFRTLIPGPRDARGAAPRAP
jgi:hypothetical protein